MLKVIKKKLVLKSITLSKSVFLIEIDKKDKMKITIGKTMCILLYFKS